MKNWQDIVWKLLFGIVIIFFGGWLLGGVLNLVAMASPRMVSVVFCPIGSTATALRPGQIVCHDQNGGSIPTLTEAESVALQRKYFYTPSLIVMVMLVIGWLLWPSLRQVKRKQANG
jgi:hypothetical protein